MIDSFVARENEKLSKPGPISTKYLFWEAHMRRSLQRAFRPLLDVVYGVLRPDSGFNWFFFGREEWLKAASERDQVAYVLGAIDFARFVKKLLLKTFEMTEGEVRTRLDDREELEEAINSFLDGRHGLRPDPSDGRERSG